MPITKTKDHPPNLKKKKKKKKNYQRPWPCAPPSVLCISGNLRRDRISKTVSEKDLCDQGNYCWRETNRNINLIVPNLGRSKR